MYNLKALHSFVAVAESGSFRKAAELLNRSQSAVSMQVRQLEDQIGVALFHRTTRRVQLTHEGEVLLARAQRAVAEFDAGLRELREAANIESGRISMICVPSVAATLLPQVLRRFRDARPGITLSLRELTSAGILRAVEQQEVDFGIGPMVDRASDLEFTPLVSEPIVAVIPRPWWLPGHSHVTLHDLAAMPVLQAPTTAALRGNLDRELAALGLTLSSKFEVANVQTMLAFARAGLGVAILPAMTAPQTSEPGLQVLPVMRPVMARMICLITLRGTALSPAARELTTLIHDSFAADVAQAQGRLSGNIAPNN